MTPLTAEAVTLDGKKFPLPPLSLCAVTSRLSSPAQGCALTAPVESFPPEIGQITVRQGPAVLFRGQVDRQVSSISSDGRLLSLECRSKGALLLDNEAAPRTLAGPQLSTVFGLFAAPYGFLLIHGGAPRRLPFYTVPKGISEWEALCGFTRRVYSLTPYVEGDQVIVDRPRSAGALVIGGGGLPYTSLERTYQPYHMLSEVRIRDMEGFYRSAVRNSSAAYHGVRRRRYAIPPNEFVDNPALDANQRIRRSMLRSEQVRAVLPGIVHASPGREVRVAGGELAAENLLAEEVTLRQSPSGITTELLLVSSLYYS